MRLMKGYDPDHKTYLLELFDKSRRVDSHLLISVRHYNVRAGQRWSMAGLPAVCTTCLHPPRCTLPPFLSPLPVPFSLPPAFLFLSGCQKTVCFWMPRLPHVSCSVVSSLVSRHSEAYVRVGARSCARIPSGFWQTQKTETTLSLEMALRGTTGAAASFTLTFLPLVLCPFLKCVRSICNASGPGWGGVNSVENTEDTVSTLWNLQRRRGSVLSALMGEYRVPWRYRADRLWGGTLDSTKDREVGPGVHEPSREL